MSSCIVYIVYIVDYIMIFLTIVVFFTVSDVKFSGTVRFLKKGFCSDSFLDVAFHVGVR